MPKSDADLLLRCDQWGVTTEDGWSSSRFDCSLSGGRALSLIGGLNSGKSVIFEHLAGIRRPGIFAVGQASAPIAHLIPQDARLAALPTDRVGALLGLSTWAGRLERITGHRWPPPEREQEAIELLTRLRLSPKRVAQLPFRELSMGERRSVIVCSVLLKQPRLLFFDGWDESMDGHCRRAISDLLRERVALGMGLFIGSRNFPLRDFPEVEAVELPSPNQLEAHPFPLVNAPQVTSAHHFPLLELNRVSLKAKKRSGSPRRSSAPIIDGASLFVRHGECVALLGVTGSGKTRLLETIAGLTTPSSGTVRVANHDVTSARGFRGRHLRRDVQLVFQDASSVLEGHRTVRFHLNEALSMVKRKEGTPTEWLEKVGLPTRLLDSPTDQLSTSECQRVDLARSLVLKPSLILLDSPEVAGINSDGGQLYAFLGAEKTKGRAFLIATSDPDVAGSLADRVAILSAGRIIEMGHKNDVLNHPRHPMTEALLTGSPLKNRADSVLAHGCPHAELCARRLEQCSSKEPLLTPANKLASGVLGHRVACFNPIQ